MADIIFTGNLGANSELKYTKGGSPVLSFRAADSKSTKDDSGNWQKVSEQWFNVEIWGSMAEFLADKLLTGVRVKVYGQFYKRDYEGKNGAGVSLDVKASAVEVLTSYKDREKITGNNTQTSQQSDPWATPGVSNSGGWGSGPDNSPPFCASGLGVDS